MSDYFPVPSGFMAADLVDAIGHRLAADLAVHSRDEARVIALMDEARALVGDSTFSRVLYVAVGTMATGFIGPLMEASDAAGLPTRAQCEAQAVRYRRIVDRQVKQ